MKITIYHVTSSLFLKSIKDNGLKAVDLRKQVPNLSVAMNEIMSILDQKHSDLGRDWGEPACFHDNCIKMANIDYKNPANMDFEYGSIYVTAGKVKAAQYNHHEFGSELITYFYKLYKCLFIKFGDEYKSAFDTKYRELVNIISMNKRNIILKAEIDVSDLLLDTGNELQKKDIEFIKDMQRLDHGDVNKSYRLKRTLLSDEIDLYTLDEMDIFKCDDSKFVFLGKLSDYDIPDIWPQVNLL